MTCEDILRPFGNVIHHLLGQKKYEKVAMAWFHTKMKIGFTNENVKMFHKFIDAGDVCLDIGANRGEITYYISRLTGEKGKVISFEPISEARTMLNDTVKKFNLTNVKICPTALSNETGKFEMIIPKLNGVDVFALAHLITGTSAHTDEHHETVEVETLDSVANKLAIRRIDFMKIDVEGHEYEVLKGGEKTIKKHLPVIYLEVWRTKQTEKDGQLSSDAIDWLIKNEYRGFVVNGKNFIDLHMSYIIEHNIQDFFFIPISKLSFFELY